MTAKKNEGSDRPTWTPEATVSSRRKWMQEWWTLQSPEFHEQEKGRRSTCCRMQYAGRWAGTTKDDNVRYDITCSLCGRIVSSKPRRKPVEDFKEAAAGDKDEVLENLLGPRKEIKKTTGDETLPF